LHRSAPNADLRTREYLTEAEVERLLRANKGNQWAHRDATIKNIQHTVRYTELSPTRFKNFWRLEEVHAMVGD
jgi:type 1 fimbriae regulatory protein FimB/type 1 fimbriae regulatory protein FimE